MLDGPIQSSSQSQLSRLHSTSSSLGSGLRLRLRALPFGGARPPLALPGGGRTNAKSTEIV